MSDVFARLAREGVSVWLDDSALARLDARSIERHIREGRVSGLITDPVPAALLRCSYSRRIGPDGHPAPDVLRDMAAAELRLSCDLLAPVHRDSGGRDGYVSAALDPRTARDATGVVNAARELRERVGRPNLMIQIPVSGATLPAISSCLEEGIPVQATGVFGARLHEQVLSAACTGLERARENGRQLADTAFVMSFSPGALDVAVDGRLEMAGGSEAAALLDRAGPALARLAQERQERLLDGARMRRLTEAGAHLPRLLWLASVPGTSAGRDSGPWRGPRLGPCHLDTRYVEELVCPDTITAVPEALLDAVADHACVSGDRVHGHHDDARRWLGRLAWFGVDVDAVTAGLEEEAPHRTSHAGRKVPDTTVATLDTSRTVAAQDGVRPATGIAA